MMARTIHASESDTFAPNRSTNPIVRLCLVNAVVTTLAICVNASGAEWRGPIDSPGVEPTRPRTNSWFAFGGVWTGVLTGWNPRDEHPFENYYFSPEFIDPAIGLPQAVVLGDLNKTFIIGSDDIVVPGDDAVVGSVYINGGVWTFVFEPLFVPGPMASAGSLTLNGTLNVGDPAGATPAMLTLSGAGSLTDGKMTGVSLTAGQVIVNNASLFINNEAKLVTTLNDFIGYEAEAIGTVTIAGANSKWMTEGQTQVGGNGMGEFSITDGAQVTSDTGGIAAFSGSTGTMTVTGANSTWTINGYVNIGWSGEGMLVVSNGAQVTSASGSIGLDDGSTGTVTVTGGNSMWTNTGVLTVGIEGVGRLTVSDNATVQASSIEIGPRGEVDGDGSIIGNVVNGGHVSPGNSPGALTIEGDYFQEDVGVLELEFAGLDSSQHDRLMVTGNATLDGDVVFKFINDFAPQEKQQFEFLIVDGTTELSAATFSVRNLAPGFLFDIAPSAAGYTMTALNDGTFIPEPASALLLILAANSATWRVRRFV